MIDATDILSARILIVDDDADAANTLAQALTLHGYSAVSATSDPRAVRELHREHEYDLIVRDLQMPSLDGFAVMEGCVSSNATVTFRCSPSPGNRVIACARSSWVQGISCVSPSTSKNCCCACAT